MEREGKSNFPVEKPAKCNLSQVIKVNINSENRVDSMHSGYWVMTIALSSVDFLLLVTHYPELIVNKRSDTYQQ